MYYGYPAAYGKPWQIGDYRFLLSVVMGIIWHSGDGETLEEVINAVEYAVFRAKSGKSGEICYCDKEMLDGLERRRKVIMILKKKSRTAVLRCIISLFIP